MGGKLLDKIQNKFFAVLDTKTGWGKNDVKSAYKDAVIKVLGEELGKQISQEIRVDNGWECEDSPTGYCDYKQEDGSYDEDCCRYCGDPEERK